MDEMKPIKQVSDLAEFAGRLVLIRREGEGGADEKFGLLKYYPSCAGDSYGLTLALVPGHGDGVIGISLGTLKRNKVFVRLATAEECQGMTLSYGERMPAAG